jgi:hypothetical protein
MKPQSLPALTWNDDDPQASIGPGQSRPEPGAQTRMYRLVVKPAGGQRMKVLLHAEDAERATRYASNRWPGAAVSKPEPVT